MKVVKEESVASEEADIVTIVSSDLIATVMEDYFNKKMYKLPVHIVELKPTEAGYSFFLQFVQKVKEPEMVGKMYKKTVDTFVNGRDNKGKFTKKGTVYE